MFSYIGKRKAYLKQGNSAGGLGVNLHMVQKRIWPPEHIQSGRQAETYLDRGITVNSTHYGSISFIRKISKKRPISWTKIKK